LKGDIAMKNFSESLFVWMIIALLVIIEVSFLTSLTLSVFNVEVGVIFGAIARYSAIAFLMLLSLLLFKKPRVS